MSKIYEFSIAGHVNPEKPIWKKTGDREPPTSAMVLAFGVLRPATVYKYEKIIKLEVNKSAYIS